MIRHRRLVAAFAAACSAALVLGACGSGDSASASNAAQSTVDAGDPVAGGTGRILQMGEPRSLDPAALSNTWAHQPTLGNALYGTLMVTANDTLELEYKMATDFSTADGGKTFTLALRPDLAFSDGSPLDAAAVKYNLETCMGSGLAAPPTSWWSPTTDEGLPAMSCAPGWPTSAVAPRSVGGRSRWTVGNRPGPG